MHLSKNDCHIYNNDMYTSYYSCEQAEFTQKHFSILSVLIASAVFKNVEKFGYLELNSFILNLHS